MEAYTLEVRIAETAAEEAGKEPSPAAARTAAVPTERRTGQQERAHQDPALLQRQQRPTGHQSPDRAEEQASEGGADPRADLRPSTAAAAHPPSAATEERRRSWRRIGAKKAPASMGDAVTGAQRTRSTQTDAADRGRAEERR